MSLLWKLLLPSVLIFSLISGLMAYQGWSLLTKQLEQKDQEQLLGDSRILLSLFDQLRNQYGHIGTELSAAFVERGQLGLVDYIEESTDIFARLNWALAYDGEANLLASWSAYGLAADVSSELRLALLQQAMQEVRPVGRLYCAEECEYLLAMPGSLAGKEAVYMLLAAPLLEIVPMYQSLTGGAMAIFNISPHGEVKVLAQSLKRQLSSLALRRLVNVRDGRTNEDWIEGQFFAYRNVELNRLAIGTNQVHILLLRDLTQARFLAGKQALRQFLLNLAVVLLGCLCLYWIISRNLNRLRRVTEVLPQLSESGHYAETREALRDASPARWASDEVDALRLTLEWLSERLEALHGAEAASESKSRFLATMSHEIRTPMSGILGLTEILKKSSLPADERRMAAMIYESTSNLLEIINDVLDYSRIEAGAAEVDHTEFSILNLLEAVADVVSVAAQRKNLRLKVLLGPDVPLRVIGDQGKLRQVLLNLTANAIKFTEKGNVSLRVNLAWKHEAECGLDFVVSDTGIGIPKDAQEKVFQRFSQADSTTTRRFGGTGLGLAISAGLADVMGGKIGLQSQEGKGSAFTLSVPLEFADWQQPDLPDLSRHVVELALDQDEQVCFGRILAAAGASLHTCDGFSSAGATCVKISDSFGGDRTQLDVQFNSAEGTETLHVRRPLKLSQLCELVKNPRASVEFAEDAPGRGYRQFAARVLVAEDQPINRELLGRQLKQLGCEAALTSDGVEALATLERDPSIAIVVTDLHMPQMDGYQLALAMRAHKEERIRTLPLVVLTASASPEDLAKLHKFGVNRKLVKPARIDELEQCFAELGVPLSEESSAQAEQAESEPTVAAEMAPATVHVASSKALDLELLKDVLGEDLGILSSYRPMFEETARPLLDVAAQAWREKDLEALGAAFHRLKGSCRSLGGVRLAQLIEQAEWALKRDEYEPVMDGFLEKIGLEFDALLAALDELIQAA